MYVHLRAAALAVALMSLARGHNAAAQSGAAAALLVTPQQLSRELSDPALVILQVGPKETYEAGHIAGARFIGLSDIAAPRVAGALALELPSESELRTRLENLGISDASRVVVVGDSDWVSPATRVVWTLQTAGLGARTRLLNGGAAAWKRAGLPVTKEVPPAATPGKLTLAADRSVLVDNAWMQTHLKSPGIRVIDGRAPMFYEGVGMPEHNAKAGHIPGAKNIPFNSLTTDSLDLLPTAELRRIFAAAGVQPGDTVAAYCHVGQQATVVIFAARLLGHPARLYDGSMNDWETRKLPLENEHPDKKQPPPDR